MKLPRDLSGAELIKLLCKHHGYRYAWAERAKVVGMPERFAQAALGHNSKAIHRAYAKKAQIIVPSLEEYEAKAATASLQKAVTA
jgi:hypothetical protein